MELDLKIGDVVRLKGLNKRGKERVNNFGPKFVVKSFELPGVDNTKGCMLFESLEKNFRCGSNMTTWSGWLEPGIEVDFSL